MRENPISFASIFTKDSSLDPLCSICFFIAPGGWANAGTITHYLAQKVVPELDDSKLKCRYYLFCDSRQHGGNGGRVWGRVSGYPY